MYSNLGKRENKINNFVTVMDILIEEIGNDIFKKKPNLLKYFNTLLCNIIFISVLT